MINNSSGVVLLISVLLSGCSTFESSKPLALIKGSKPHPAARCLCLWQQAESMDQSGRSRLGFSGQIYFFAVGNPSPVPVDGDVTVLMFDSRDRAESLREPIAEYPFNSEQWNLFRTDSKIGTAYGLFAPYPDPTVRDANCALRIRLTQPDGSQVYSELSEIRLSNGEGFKQPSETRISAPDPKPEKRWSLDRQAGESQGQVATIGYQKDGEFMRVQDNVRRIGNATDQPFAIPDERQLRLELFERRLNELQSRPESRAQRSSDSEAASGHEMAADVFGAGRAGE